MSSSDTPDTIVLGAGLAGLAFALEMQEKGHKVLVLEKDAQIGGLSKTLEHKGFLLDYCAHRFHSANPKVMGKVKAIMGDNFQRYNQRSRILMFGRFLKYPFELQNLLRAMPLHQSFMCGVDFALNLVKKSLNKNPAPAKNYRAWFVRHFGENLYKVMCEPYTTKIWKNPPELLSADWADQRFQGVNLRKLLKRVLMKIVKLDFSSYSLDDENLAPDGGEFFYPRRGIQQVADRYAELIREKGGEILTEATFLKADTQNRTVTYRKDGQEHTVAYQRAVVSTVPLHILAHGLDHSVAPIEADLSALDYMNVMFVFLFLNKDKVSADHWLYFPDPKIIFNRSVEFKTWSAEMAPPDKTALCLDMTCFGNDPIWTMPDQQLIDRCIADAAQTGLIDAKDVYEARVDRVTHAYPFYDLDYQRKVTNIVKHCESRGDIFCLGRTGIFQYNNADGSIEMGMELAERLTAANTDATDRGLLNYKFKHISY